MKKCQVMAAAALLIGLAALGCGSDNKVTGPAAAEQFEALEFPLGKTLEYLFAQLEFDPGDLDEFDPAGNGQPSGGLGWQAAVDSDSITIIYVYQDDWHIISWTGGFEHGDETGVDSIQFTDSAGQPHEDPDRDTTAAVRFIERLSLMYDDDTFDGTSTTYVDLSYSNLQESSIYVGGIALMTIDLNAIVEDKQYHWDVACSLDVQDIMIPNPDFGGSGCSEGGSLAMTLIGSYSGYNAQGNPISFTVNATGTAVFNAGATADITVSIGGSQFSETVTTCGSS